MAKKPAATAEDDLIGTKTKPAAKKATADKAAAKPAAKKGKAEDDEDLLGTKPAAKKSKAKVEAADEAADEAAPKAKTKKVKEPVVFTEGERDELLARIPKLVKKPINSRDLAVKLEISTRKLRPLLYSLERAEVVKLESGESRLAGMTVSLP